MVALKFLTGEYKSCRPFYFIIYLNGDKCIEQNQLNSLKQNLCRLLSNFKYNL